MILDAMVYSGLTPLDTMILTIYFVAGVPLTTDGARAYADGACIARVMRAEGGLYEQEGCADIDA